ncbi:MAG: glycosyltransferase family 2 protein [Candidatus Curtissbacteria bacterium]|nr:glycosyltransferase family 2 protein [Candidatus Curtissbacteria bacterium]
MKISALILAKNEEEMIEDALSQLNFVDEIIVLSQNSYDNTKKIALRYTDKVFETKVEDFSKNRNFLAEKASGDWLLYVDADERFDAKNKEEIKKALAQNESFKAYYFPRKNMVLGTWVKHANWWPDYVPRLIKKENLVTWRGRVHESPEIEGDFGYLKNPITHLTARNMTLMLEKSIRWAKIEAQLYNKASNPRVTQARIIRFCLFKFLHRYFYKLEILDGRVGLISAIYQALHDAMTLTYLWEIQNDTQHKFEKAVKSI